jgi:hypothetical protein
MYLVSLDMVVVVNGRRSGEARHQRFKVDHAEPRRLSLLGTCLVCHGHVSSRLHFYAPICILH